MPKHPPPGETPPPRRRPRYITGYSTYHLRQPWSLRQRTVPNGEVADAYLGSQGLNRRKGVCNTSDDVLDELSDVIITATVAMNSITGDTRRAGEHLERRLSAVTVRAGL